MGEQVARFKVLVSFRNMRAGEYVEIPDTELADPGPWTGARKWLEPVDDVTEFEVLDEGVEYAPPEVAAPGEGDEEPAALIPDRDAAAGSSADEA